MYAVQSDGQKKPARAPRINPYRDLHNEVLTVKPGGIIMQVVVRAYSGKKAKKLFNVLEEHKADVEKLMRSVKGIVNYTLARTSDGGYSVTVCEDKAGIDESVAKAKEWIANNAEKIGAGAPKVSDGEVIIHC